MKSASRTLSPGQVLCIKGRSITLEGEWGQCLGTIDRHGVALVWGASGSGKTSGVMMLAKELCKHGKVLWLSLEMGFSLSFRNALQIQGMADCGSRLQILDRCPLDELKERLAKKASPEFVVIDSLQYLGINYREYKALKEQFPGKLFIFISHAKGPQPAGRTAESILYDADIKVFVEGGRATTRGRFFGPRQYAVIWPEKAFDYYGPQISE